MIVMALAFIRPLKRGAPHFDQEQKPMIKTALLLAFIALVAVALYFVPVRELAVDLVAEIEQFGGAATVVFLALYVVFAVLGFSRTLLHIVAGIVFDPFVAVVVVFLSSLCAFVSTFSIARYLAGQWVEERLKKISAARTLLSIIDNNGLRLVILMRMNPFVPGFVNGYGFGLTSIKFGPYLLGSVMGSLPLSLIHVYLGWAGGESILRGDGQPQAMQSATLLIGVVISLVLIAGISWYGHRAVQQAAAETAASESVPA